MGRGGGSSQILAARCFHNNGLIGFSMCLIGCHVGYRLPALLLWLAALGSAKVQGKIYMGGNIK